MMVQPKPSSNRKKSYKKAKKILINKIKCLSVHLIKILLGFERYIGLKNDQISFIFYKTKQIC